MNVTGNVTVRAADVNDVSLLCAMVHELSEFEKMGDKCTLTEKSLEKIMTETNGIRAFLAFSDGEPAGMALYNTYRLATFSGRRVMYLEDLFVREKFRKKGVGSALFRETEKCAKELDCVKLEWKCIFWNDNAKAFYERHGGVSDGEWLTFDKRL
ncbi:MAG: GNAT family N-acetyltransferase [Ruminococcus sp.]|nr:GNAT family N-acetyltransferase [Ruminococcus sp.]